MKIWKSPQSKCTPCHFPHIAEIRRYGTKTIDIEAGEDPTEKFTVHDKLFSASSEFCHTMLDKDWKEREENRIKLPDIEPDDFRMYVRWLYTNECIY